jgi:hypothetical protein
MRGLFLLSLLAAVVANVPSAAAVELFFNDNVGIHRFDSNQAAAAAVLYETFETRGIFVDSSAERLWWSDVFPLGAPIPGGVIRGGDAAGGQAENVVGPGLPAPAGVAVDRQSGRIFWTDLGDVTNPAAVYSASLDGSDRQRIISGPSFAEIAGIALDPVRDKLYFTYINPLIDALYAGGIARADFNGENVEPIVGGLGKPIGVAVDPHGGGVYWADAGLSSDAEDGLIRAANLDGEGQRTILGGLDDPYGVALDLVGRDVYWTDNGTGKVQRTGMAGVLPFFQDVLTDLKHPTALAIPLAVFTPGDATGDGHVDRTDMTVLARNYGRSGAGVDWFAGDFNGDRTVSQIDLAILQANLSGDKVSAAAAASAPIPEPALGIPIAIAVLAWLCVYRCRTTFGQRGNASLKTRPPTGPRRRLRRRTDRACATARD